MRKFHTKLLHIPRPYKLQAVLDIYRQSKAGIPIKLPVIQRVIESVIKRRILCDSFPFEGRKAYVQPMAGCFWVTYSESSPTWTRRSDIAHEFGHILHSYKFEPHEGFIDLLISAMPEEEKELEEHICDQIGATLLCPGWALESVLRDPWFSGLKTESALVEALSRKFMFPQEELEAHLKRLYGTVETALEIAQSQLRLEFETEQTF